MRGRPSPPSATGSSAPSIGSGIRRCPAFLPASAQPGRSRISAAGSTSPPGSWFKPMTWPSVRWPATPAVAASLGNPAATARTSAAYGDDARFSRPARSAARRPRSRQSRAIGSERRRPVVTKASMTSRSRSPRSGRGDACLDAASAVGRTRRVRASRLVAAAAARPFRRTGPGGRRCGLPAFYGVGPAARGEPDLCGDRGLVQQRLDVPPPGPARPRPAQTRG